VIRTLEDAGSVSTGNLRNSSFIRSRPSGGGSWNRIPGTYLNVNALYCRCPYLCLSYHFFHTLKQVNKEVTSVANVHGIEFSSNQSELVKGLIRDLLKDGNCAVYALPHMKPNGELRMACTPPAPSPRRQHGVFLRIRPGVSAAIAIRPMNAKTGAEQTSITKYSRQELLEIIRLWRNEVSGITPEPPIGVALAKAA
jgi:hypothetical protein